MATRAHPKPHIATVNKIPPAQVANAGNHGNRSLLLRALPLWADFLSILAIGYLALALRFNAPIKQNLSSWKDHLGLLILFCAITLLSCGAQQLYTQSRKRSLRDEAWAIAQSVAIGSVFVMCFAFLSNAKTISRFVFVFEISATLVAMTGWRYIRHRDLLSKPADGITCKNVLIVGLGSIARALNSELHRSRHLAFRSKGFLTTDFDDRAHWKECQVLGSVDDLKAIARAHFIDELFITVVDREFVKRIVAEALGCGLSVRLVPDLYDGLAWSAPIEYVGAFPLIALHSRRDRAAALLFKRWLDVCCSATLLLILSPVILLTAIAIKLDSEGPILYVSERVGRKKLIFRCYKFRTMVANAESLKASLQHLNERHGILFKVSKDPRITKLGRILRKYSIDEIPQFWNVLRGDMSLVGPRPPLASEVQQYELEHMRRLNVQPGITGLWQIISRQDPSFTSYITLDLQYVEFWDLRLDFEILLKTVGVVLAGTGQ